MTCHKYFDYSSGRPVDYLLLNLIWLWMTFVYVRWLGHINSFSVLYNKIISITFQHTAENSPKSQKLLCCKHLLIKKIVIISTNSS
jgi:hypothetical protein